MKKYECPHCGEKTITPLKKAFAGTQKSQGVKCPNCGTHCTNGMESSVFRCIVTMIVLIVSVVSYVKFEANVSAVVIAASLVSGFILTHLFDALFYPLTVSLRMDLRR
ncbi:MAG: hypothetical protein ACI4I9_00440 [Porcipelethomonas sp.]